MSTLKSISTLVKIDHADVKQAYQNYVLAEGNLDEQERWANEFRWGLARHSVAEELVAYPAFEKYLGAEGKQIAHQDRAEHQEIKELLKKLETTSVSNPTFRVTFDKLVEFLISHVTGEEQNDYPKLENAITPEESDSLARSYERTKMFVPTRSHPSAPNKPPFETVVGLLTAPIDKLRDLFSKFPDDK
ncbi:unnamed protein product [Rotaria sordida]|uniref:Hemerythrin-like domain-containing protein n=1 Tax=Rotaria sordida TaxID=392033 RepID=A0A819ZXE7_9BILA|nr:unnamed protein product [Rotaria sordida]CAF4179178.1 unnamed protein product [Rotaria sordida]